MDKCGLICHEECEFLDKCPIEEESKVLEEEKDETVPNL